MQISYGKFDLIIIFLLSNVRKVNKHLHLFFNEAVKMFLLPLSGIPWITPPKSRPIEAVREHASKPGLR